MKYLILTIAFALYGCEPECGCTGKYVDKTQNSFDGDVYFLDNVPCDGSYIPRGSVWVGCKDVE